MKNILILDSDTKVLEIIKKFLEPKGYIVRGARTAQEAIDLSDKIVPDVVVLELAIPNQNGIAFLHEFRSYPDWSKIPVIIHTSLPKYLYSNEDTWKVLGVKHYLYKPTTSLNELGNIIAEVA